MDCCKFKKKRKNYNSSQKIKKIVFFFFFLHSPACARDIVMFESEGLTQRLLCDVHGSYQTIQRSGLQSYCVDSMGYSVTDLMNESNPDCKKFLYDQVQTEMYC